MKTWQAIMLALTMLTGALALSPRSDAAAAVATVAPSTTGESIYRRGLLGSGTPLVGVREEGGVSTSGQRAACVNCHQRSGLGFSEGAVRVPPITGQYLFHERAGNGPQPALHYVDGAHGNRDPYTEATLARAIRTGLDSQGRPLNELMPRFALDDGDMAALIEYLKQLDPGRVPGVEDTLLHFATVFTPDADQATRRGVLDVLEHYFADKNSFPFPPSPPMRTSGRTLYSKSMYMANRHWQLHVWDLKGAPGTWRAQLAQDLAREPVMAVVSGLGGSEWAPVHDFCEQERVPCLFPNVEVPPVATGDFYSLYFSRGVLLEAGLIAKAIAGTRTAERPIASVRQIYRTGDSGEAAAQALAKTLEAQGITVVSEGLRGRTPRDLAVALGAAAGADAMVLWLRPADIAALGPPPATPARVFMSGVMGGLERSPLPAAWRSRVLEAYPFDLPERRVVRVDYPLGWFAIRRVPVVAEQVQADTYIACGLLAEALSHMADTFVRDYLVERVYDVLEHRVLTGYYPRLTLGTGQTLASKGGFLVRFAEPTGRRVVADGDWTVP